MFKSIRTDEIIALRITFRSSDLAIDFNGLRILKTRKVPIEEFSSSSVLPPYFF
jgi:hypothetical protein